MEKKVIGASINSESISDRPLNNLFFFFGLLLGAGISKFLTRTFIVPPTFSDPNTAGLFAGALTVIVILTSAWLNCKFGVYVVAKINARDSTKSIKTSIAWGVSIVSFILYLLAAGLLSEFSRINTSHQTQQQNIPYAQQAPSHVQQPIKLGAPVDYDPFASNQAKQKPSFKSVEEELAYLNANSPSSQPPAIKPDPQQAPVTPDVIDPYYNAQASGTKYSTGKEYFNMLGYLVPDWKDIYKQPAFHQFLARKYNRPETFGADLDVILKRPPDSNKPSYGDLLIEAEGNLDPVRASQIYNAFKRECGK